MQLVSVLCLALVALAAANPNKRYGMLPKIDHGLDHMSPMEVLTMKTKVVDIVEINTFVMKVNDLLHKVKHVIHGILQINGVDTGVDTRVVRDHLPGLDLTDTYYELRDVLIDMKALKFIGKGLLTRSFLIGVGEKVKCDMTPITTTAATDPTATFILCIIDQAQKMAMTFKKHLIHTVLHTTHTTTVCDHVTTLFPELKIFKKIDDVTVTVYKTAFLKDLGCIYAHIDDVIKVFDFTKITATTNVFELINGFVDNFCTYEMLFGQLKELVLPMHIMFEHVKGAHTGEHIDRTLLEALRRVLNE